jgi:ribonuclease R
MPDADKMKSFAVFVHNLGIDTRGITAESADEMSAEELSEKLRAILHDSNERGIFGIVSSVLLRSMMKAKYQHVCSMHFGLGAPTYCHFTSPIRRYPDLFVHTVITAVLEKCGLTELSAASPVSGDAVPGLVEIAPSRGESSSECELRALTAERDIEDLYMALYMRDKVGCDFHATVCSVIRSGLFVQCDNLVEGFVPATCFENAKINEETMMLTSRDKTYTLGTEIFVRLVDVEVQTGKITFELTPTDEK